MGEQLEHYTVIVSERTKQMLQRHILFIAQKNKEAAQRTKERLISAFHSLETMPERFPFLDEEYIPKNQYHKMFIEKWYLVLYQIKDQTVYIDYIIDCRQDYKWLLK